MNDVIEMQPREMPVAIQSTTPSDLLQLAIEKGADIEKLQQLMALQERWEASQARKAYVAAMTEFKQNPPEIFKTKEVAHSGISYKHATLGDVTSITVAALAKHGFSHRWDTIQPGDGRIIVHCILTHRLGHSETDSMEATPDISGKKNSIQAIASTVTYLQRYTLLSACGLATKDQVDDDGQGSTETTKRPLPTIGGKAFDKAVASVKAGTYDSKEIAKFYALTLDQEITLADAEKESAK